MKLVRMIDNKYQKFEQLKDEKENFKEYGFLKLL